MREDRRQKTEDRRQKTEDRRQKIEDRRQKTISEDGVHQNKAGYKVMEGLLNEVFGTVFE